MSTQREQKSAPEGPKITDKNIYVHTFHLSAVFYFPSSWSDQSVFIEFLYWAPTGFIETNNHRAYISTPPPKFMSS